jgi:hypothetical protein
MINADRNTFAFVNDYFLKDKDSVYVSLISDNLSQSCLINGNVEAINKQYIRIGNTIYFPPFRQDSEVVTSSFDKIDKIRVINQDIISINNNTILSRGKKFKYDQVDANSFQLFPLIKVVHMQTILFKRQKQCLL